MTPPLFLSSGAEERKPLGFSVETDHEKEQTLRGQGRRMIEWRKRGGEQKERGFLRNRADPNPGRKIGAGYRKKLRKRGDLAALTIVAQTSVWTHGDVPSGLPPGVMTVVTVIRKRT